jgi:SAM-dependent methyltransferase
MQGREDAFPAIYHAHHSRHSDDLPFWLRLAARHPGPILELGCGTGRVLLPLAAAGNSVIGLDRDAAMLDFLRQMQPEAVHARVLQADMAHFHLARRFGLILLPCNTYSTLGASARNATLERIHAHLAPGGRFVFSIPNPSLLRGLPARGSLEFEEAFSHPLDGTSVEVYSAWRRSGDTFTILWRYEHRSANGILKRASIRVDHYLLSAREHLAGLRQAGLRVRAAFGDFDSSEYTRDAPALIIIASL